MGVIDVDHEILSANARVAMHAAEQMMVHIAAEIKNWDAVVSGLGD